MVLIGDKELNFDCLCNAVHAFCSAEDDKMRKSAISVNNPLQVVVHNYDTPAAIRRGRRDLKEKAIVDFNYHQTVLRLVAVSIKTTPDHDLVDAFLGFQSPKLHFQSASTIK